MYSMSFVNIMNLNDLFQCMYAVAPICYAHLAAAQMSQFVKFDDMSDAASSHSGGAGSSAGGFTQLPKLHEKVCSSMFFC